jgi:SAM-dependent methyltransferase
MTQPSSPPVLDYDAQGDYIYRRDFWERGNRAYEDLAERYALAKLLQPAQGRRLLELGAGFGRLSSFFSGYEEVILVDYSRSHLEDARQRLGAGKYRFVAANIYALPLVAGSCDGATLIRTLHHLADPAAALRQVRQSLAEGSVFILEYANKRNLKAMLRYALGQQAWSPYDSAPLEFVQLHYDFHPAYILKALKTAGFETRRQIGVSYLRLNLLKRLLPAPFLAGIDSLLQESGWLVAPSVFSQNVVAGTRPATLPSTLFKCLACGHHPLEETTGRITCQACGRGWSTVGGIYDFRQPLV